MPALLTTALIAGGIAAAAPAIGHGIGALSSASRAQRRMRKEMTRQAEADMARGQREGWGYSERRKREMLAGQMREFDKASEVDRTEQMRQVAVQGIGRGGQIDANRAAMSRARGEMAAQTKGAIRQESVAVGQQRRADARNLYMQAQGMNLEAAQRGTQALVSTLSAGANAGLSTYAQGKQQEHEKAMAAAAAQTMQNMRGMNVGNHYPS